MITKFTVSEPTTYYGLSTDSKPIGTGVINGSVFVEMNTGKVYFYNAAGATWVEV